MSTSSSWSLQDAYALDPPEELVQYRVDAPLAVRECLRALRDRCTPLTLHPLASIGCVSARLVTINSPIDRIELSVDAQRDLIVALRSFDRIDAVGLVDHVKVQCALTQLEHVESAHELRLRALLPVFLFRRQRRDTYRVRLWASRPAHCSVPARDGAHAGTFEVLDASIGGLSLCWGAQRVPVCGELLEDCVLALPDVAPFRCDLHVRSVEPGDRDGAAAWRIGCAFEALSGPLQRAMQRFVFDVDRRSLQQQRAARIDQQPQ